MSGERDGTVDALIEALRADGVELWTEGNRLRFRAPPEALSEAAKETLRAHREEVIAELRRQAAETRKLGPVAANQSGLWLVQELAPDSSAYNVAFATRILSRVDTDALEEAFQVLIDRHEALRTAYVLGDDGEPGREIRGHVPFHLQLIDAADDSEEEVATAAQVAYDEPFALGEPPLIRAHLFRRAPDWHLLLLNAHHLAVDGQSLFVLVDELFAVYGALAAGSPIPTRSDSVDFSEFVSWQRGAVADAVAAREYWQGMLTPPPAPLDLPADHPRPATSRMTGGTIRFTVEPQVAQPLRDLAAAQGATEYILLLAAWSAYLGRLTGAHDVTVGSPVQGRPSVRFERTVGDFVNVIPMRTHLAPGMTFREHVDNVRRVARESLAHQDYPLPLMTSGRAVDDARGAPFETLFTFQDFKRHGALERLMLGVEEEFDFGGLTLAPHLLAQQEGQFTLALDVWRVGEAWGCTCKYDAELFEADSVRSRVAEFAALLASAAAQPDAPMEGLDLLSDEDVERLAQWNRTERSYDWPGGLAELVAAAGQRQPDAAAVTSRAGDLTYGELVEQAGRVTAGLQQKGIGRGDRVVILMQRGREMLAALIGVLGAGAAYVPVDPAYPEARIRQVLDSSGAGLLLTHRGLDLRFDLDHPVGDFSRLVQSEPSAFENVDPSDLAYVIYTSGSTGKPKGVEVPHGAVVNFLRSMAEAPGLKSDDVVLAVTTISFDISVLELYLPLIVGARLVIAAEAETVDADALSRRLEGENVTLMQATPATWKLLIASGWSGKADLRALCGGEALPRSLADELLERVETLWNMYGPTETTVWSTIEQMQFDEPVMIGRPIANTTVYVLDAGGRAVPVGIPGELWIGGAGVARGYHGRDDLTAERFRDSPFRDGERIYRTGDLVRFRDDGRLEHLGRLDHQVKVRGFRIEPGEVESLLRGHPTVHDAVVVARDDRLVAYVVPQAGSEDGTATGEPQLLDPDALRLLLADELPAHMVPSLFVPLEQLPLTPNGKVDRAALPAPDQRRGADRSYDLPQTETERAVAGIWQEVLEVDPIGRDDDFFRLGGHSLLVARVAARVRSACSVEIPFRQLFDQPTVAATAAWIDTHGGERTVTAIRPRDPDAPVPLSLTQERIWFLQQIAPDDTAYNLGFGLMLHGAVDADRLRNAVAQVVARHEVLRTRLRIVDGRTPMQVVLPDPLFGWTHEDLGNVPPDRAADEAMARISALLEQPYDLAEEPPLRVALMRLADDRFVLGILMHHAATDQWSLGLFNREMSIAYNQGAEALDPLPLQYGDFAVWQRQLLAGDALEDDRDYWLQALDGLQPLDLPTDRPRPKAANFDGDFVLLGLPEELQAAIRRLADAENTTPFAVLLAAYLGLLQALSNEDDIAVGVPVATRPDPALERLIGAFLNTVVHRNEVSRSTRFRDLLQGVWETAKQALAHRDMPFEQLVQELQPDRTTNRSPLFQVLFNHVAETPLPELELAGVTSEAAPLQRMSAQFELSLHVYPGTVYLEYNSTLFEAATAERLANQYLTILERAVDDPDAAVADLVSPTSADSELLQSWNRTERQYEWSGGVAELVAATAQRRGDAPAVSSAAGTWSYTDLIARAAAIASGLRNAGVQRGDRVVVVMERGREMLAALLGVLGAGAAYVPVDPTYPGARIRYVIDNSRAAALLTHRGLSGHFDLDIPVVDAADCDGGDAADFERLEPRDTAYVIYTSGSTGRPKGVEVSQGAVVNFLRSMVEMPGINADDVLLAVTTISFDIAVLELYLPLIVGARVVIAGERDVLDAAAIDGQIESERVTLMQATPATWKLLIASGWSGKADLRALCGGEALPRSLADELLGRVGELWNMYGPTETTVWSTIEQMQSDEPVLIGRPIANTTVYVLDEGGRPVAVGIPGELWIGGAGVANGYHGRDDLTAERFRDSPFRDGERIYRTGDLVRFRNDGRLEHLGRLDQQVKVRGFRIEPGDVESVLRAHPSVHDAVAVARDERLVAYVVPAPEAGGSASVADDADGPGVVSSGLDIDGLRRHTAEHVPAYMVPSVFVHLEQIPLTPNGKVDRKRLPAPDERSDHDHSHEPARTETERELALIWQQVLEIDGIGRTDDFFRLGGHSLLVPAVVAAIGERLGVEVPMAALFEHRELQALAGHVDVTAVSSPDAFSDDNNEVFVL